jgi:hypothetical protein
VAESGIMCTLPVLHLSPQLLEQWHLGPSLLLSVPYTAGKTSHAKCILDTIPRGTVLRRWRFSSPCTNGESHHGHQCIIRYSCSTATVSPISPAWAASKRRLSTSGITLSTARYSMLVDFSLLLTFFASAVFFSLHVRVDPRAKC